LLLLLSNKMRMRAAGSRVFGVVDARQPGKSLLLPDGRSTLLEFQLTTQMCHVYESALEY
jgi:hypothetical protein